jgi:triphosphoribosyl-dephospho-CoA synthase
MARLEPVPPQIWRPWPTRKTGVEPYAGPRKLGRLALGSLHAELVCSPKPGLVTPFDSGSHRDMNAATFIRSLFALRVYFFEIAQAGARGAAFTELKTLGIAAETVMLQATGGVNTHRGAIFSLGLLVAGAAALQVDGVLFPRAESVCDEIRKRWGADLLSTPPDPGSHGQLAARRYSAAGARAEAACGFPTLREIAVPALRASLASGLTSNAALCHCLMSLICHVEDTNLLHRGGRDGLAFAQESAHVFLAAGGARMPSWQARLSAIAAQFITRNLSPGGSADLLACAWFLIKLEQGSTCTPGVRWQT